MSFCEPCATAGDYNRVAFDKYGDEDPSRFMSHPEDCHCACGHKMPDLWDKMYLVKRP